MSKNKVQVVETEFLIKLTHPNDVASKALQLFLYDLDTKNLGDVVINEVKELTKKVYYA